MEITLEQIVNRSDFEPVFITLRLSSTESVTGLVVEERVSKTQKTFDKHIYDIRHEDGGDNLATLEKNVLVNWSMSIALDEKIDSLENKEYLDIVDWGYQSWIDVAYGALMELGNPEDIDCFIADHWQNLATVSENVNNFLIWKIL
jgi:hypothetical protein